MTSHPSHLPDPSDRQSQPGRSRTKVRTAATGGRLVATLLVALFVLHQDVWLWRDPRLVFGLPVGLAWHVAFCLAVTAVLALAVRRAWPHDVPVDEGEEREGRK